ncbi:hypothetical protein R3P38DRAFT_974936 [Favolaschia claudopus]|uniref:Uncharacterized protein n=1 Tax=Favolaschia claudopus TaxID=2862362 RepID=A0AAW0E7U0_9AGAR
MKYCHGLRASSIFSSSLCLLTCTISASQGRDQNATRVVPQNCYLAVKTPFTDLPDGISFTFQTDAREQPALNGHSSRLHPVVH